MENVPALRKRLRRAWEHGTPVGFLALVGAVIVERREIADEVIAGLPPGPRDLAAMLKRAAHGELEGVGPLLDRFGRSTPLALQFLAVLPRAVRKKVATPQERATILADEKADLLEDRQAQSQQDRFLARVAARSDPFFERLKAQASDYGTLLGDSGLSVVEAAAFHDAKPETVEKWLAEGWAPQQALGRMRHLRERQERQARVTACLLLTRAMELAPGERGEIVVELAADQRDAQSQGWPTVSAHRAVLKRLRDLLPEYDVVISQRDRLVIGTPAEMYHVA